MEENTQPTPEPQVEPTAEVATPHDAAPEAAAETTAEAPVFDWRKALDDAPAEEIRRHPRFAGIVGSEQQAWRQTYEQEQAAKANAAAKQQAEDDLREMARRNPVEFADRWLGQEEARQQQERLSGLETNARRAVGAQIGAAFHTIPEWAQIASDADSLARLAMAIEGKSQDEVLTAWNTTAVTLVAERRAQALFEKEIAARLKAERAAWETEAAAQGFRFSDRPDLGRGGRPTTSADPEPDFKDQKAWSAWYRRTTPGAA